MLRKSDIDEAVFMWTGLNKKMIEKITTRVFEIMKSYMAKGQSVSIKGFGRFEVKKQGEKNCMNPYTGERMTLSPRKVVRFKQSDILRKSVMDGKYEMR